MRYLYLLLLTLITIAPLFAQSNLQFRFNGNGGAVTLPNASALLVGETQMSMTAWVNTENTGCCRGYLGFRTASDMAFYMLQLNNGDIEMRFKDGSADVIDCVPTGAMNVGEWHHLALVVSPTGLRGYVDGALACEQTASIQPFTNPNVDFDIGRTRDEVFNFSTNASIDEVSLWNKALNDAEVMAIYTNEITPEDPNLLLYYKFDHGISEGDNTQIPFVYNHANFGGHHAVFDNLTLMGANENFVGTKAADFQQIDFPLIPDQIQTRTEPILLNATASSGLPITYTLIDGPAIVTNNEIELIGLSGTVKVQASQVGNGEFAPASPITHTFNVINPADPTNFVFTPILPKNGDNYHVDGVLRPIKLIVKAESQSELVAIEQVEFRIDGKGYLAEATGNGFFQAYYLPTTLTPVTASVQYTTTQGDVFEENLLFSVTDNYQTETINILSAYVGSGNFQETMTVDLPNSTSAYRAITLSIEANQPANNDWATFDLISDLLVETKSGEWVNLVRYISPFRLECSDQIDLTQFAALLSGQTRFRFRYTAFDGGYDWIINLTYEKGAGRTTEIQPLWMGNYPFGDFANLQPLDTLLLHPPEHVLDMDIWHYTSGHGWNGNSSGIQNNTDNAAEFSNNTHFFHINGEQVYENNNWRTCNPNPANCSNQNGTWQFARAGWCPGAINLWKNYALGSYLPTDELSIWYQFDPTYEDLCHPNHPDCEDGVTCPDCSGTGNSSQPVLDVATFVVYELDETALVTVTSIEEQVGQQSMIQLVDNLVEKGQTLQLVMEQINSPVSYQIMDITGKVWQKGKVQQKQHRIVVPVVGGMYFVVVSTNSGRWVERFVVD